MVEPFSLADIGASLPPFVAVRVPTVETNPVTLEPGLLPTDAIGAEWATAIMVGGGRKNRLCRDFGVQVGVCSADGRRHWMLRLYDGKMADHLGAPYAD